MFFSIIAEDFSAAAGGPCGFYPRSRLRLERHGERTRLRVDPQTPARAGSLRFFQGAFGFAPRIVILRQEATVFDRIVPFVTRLRGPDGIAFEGRFTVESERLEVDGIVDLASLDEALRGHATLALTVQREGTLLGRGSLLPGHFATLDQGYRIGFAGLEKWSEIDISRRNYGQLVLVGAAVALLAAVGWPIAVWRGW